jgi:hypothetical protein
MLTELFRKLHGDSANLLGFVDQHDGDIVFNRIAQFAGFTYEAVLFIG